MQVEYKTGKGFILFVKLPDDAKFWKSEAYHVSTLWYKTEDMRNPKHIQLPYSDLKLIGLTNEIAEEQAKTIVKSWIGTRTKVYLNYNDYMGQPFITALDSFKSLMQHLQVYEKNLYEHFECPNQWCDNGYIDQGYNEKWRCEYCDKAEQEYEEVQSRTGKWAVLFKSELI